ncbi:BMP family lipoprotein [Candidatus Galacturonibacter soehngenii]|uniref:BMP family ABC transporter substrate-binding protein n=1 Tax=Candidatus Galacturonatibacter soehngenii TaxID=2307010 RepID=A0A7V7QL10_9FIRM|nr:BMP family ABC transporter substrate-binding protein [Candidatus Galacturonibacter soehngenii]KAB1438563.1 BMP family ABC transporter substrate-binding protein [Candidatus Galacturonibacter soehngenii]
MLGKRLLGKRLFVTVFYLVIVTIHFIGCTSLKKDTDESDSTQSLEVAEEETYEIALVSDLGTIKDQSFNQASWEGIMTYALEHGVSYKNYQPEEGTLDAYVDNIELAIKNGAKLVVCPGYNFETPIFIVQDKYPEVTFILIDGEPHNVAYSESRIEDNVLAIMFQEEEAGFLAGYAAVKEGYTKLGFIGGMAVPAVIKYGYGFVQGCEKAAMEMGIQTEIVYTYAGTFGESDDAKNMAASWYQNGTQIIFACGGAIGNSVIEAAEMENGYVIGVDADQGSQSNVIITSAMKMIMTAVYQGIEQYYSGAFPGGTIQRFSAENNGIGLPMDTSRFRVFSKENYESIYKKLVAGEIQIINNEEDSTTKDIPLIATHVEFIH